MPELGPLSTSPFLRHSCEHTFTRYLQHRLTSTQILTELVGPDGCLTPFFQSVRRASMCILAYCVNINDQLFIDASLFARAMWCCAVWYSLASRPCVHPGRSPRKKGSLRNMQTVISELADCPHLLDCAPVFLVAPSFPRCDTVGGLSLMHWSQGCCRASLGLSTSRHPVLLLHSSRLLTLTPTFPSQHPPKNRSHTHVS